MRVCVVYTRSVVVRTAVVVFYAKCLPTKRGRRSAEVISPRPPADARKARPSSRPQTTTPPPGPRPPPPPPPPKGSVVSLCAFSFAFLSFPAAVQDAINTTDARRRPAAPKTFGSTLFARGRVSEVDFV